MARAAKPATAKAATNATATTTRIANRIGASDLALAFSDEARDLAAKEPEPKATLQEVPPLSYRTKALLMACLATALRLGSWASTLNASLGESIQMGMLAIPAAFAAGIVAIY